MKRNWQNAWLAIILAGDSKPSAMYASFMQKAAKSYGINSGIFKEAEDVSEDELGKLITDLSNDDEITGILMMMPLPEQIDPEKMIALIDPDKADGHECRKTFCRERRTLRKYTARRHGNPEAL